MPLQLILGNSGSGKSHLLYKKVIQASLEEPGRVFLVVVPEQFTLQTQKELIRMHPRKGILNIDVLSFQRLAYRVFEEVGGESRVVLEDTGKNLLLRKVALEEKERLLTLGSSIHKLGYITQVKSLISELTQYDVTPEKLEELIQFAKDKPRLYYKLKDMAVLYEGFRRKTENAYITSEEVLDALNQAAGKSRLLKDCVIALDGFTGFTPIQQKLLRTLMKLSSDMMVTVTLDAKEDPWRIGGKHQLFYLSKKTIHMLSELAKETRTEMREPVALGEKGAIRYQDAPALAFLEQHFLRYDRMKYKKEQAEISIHASKNALEEAHFAARTITGLIREKGYRFQDIAVIAGDMASYGEYVKKVFSQYEIPVFVDETKAVLLNPMIEFIRAALEAASKDFSYDSMFRYLRTGLCGISTEEADLLENYVLAVGIRGSAKWNEPWERTTRGQNEEKRDRCNEIREKVMGPLGRFAGQVKGRKRKTALQLTQALYELIISVRMQEQMCAYQQEFEQEKKLEQAREYGQIYGIVMELLDKVAELLGEEKLTLKEYIEILEAGFEEAKVGNIPPTSDRILVGDMERTRLKGIRALIFLGLNDGWVPKSGGKAGILSDMDREELEGAAIELAPTLRETSYIQKFYLYLNLTKPKERLYLSYSKSAMDGAAMRPSYVINSIRHMYTYISVTDEEERAGSMERILTPENGFHYLIEGFREGKEGKLSPEWKELYSWYYQNEDYRKRTEQFVHAAFLSRSQKGLGGQVALALYGNVLVNSVSRLERFAACAFTHFLQYGLRLVPREEYAFVPMDLGNVIHQVMELFSKKVDAGSYAWGELPKEVAEAWADACVEEVTREYGAGILHSTFRNEYAILRMKRIMRRTVWALCKQVQAGSFVPSSYEVSFSMAEDLESINIALSEKEKMRLKGRIDRIDICEREDQVYVKIIDYKSGNTGFDIAALYYGLQLQLVVYMNAALELEKRVHPDKEVIPGGIFYYRVQDPMLEREEMTPQEVNRRLLRQLKPDGLVNQDPAVIKALDQNIGKDSDVIPVSYNKDGSPSRYASVASTEQFAGLSEFVNQKMKELGKEILHGKTAARPYERKGRTPCEYCDYQAVCGFDPRIPGNQVRRLRDYKPEEVWKMIWEEVNQ